MRSATASSQGYEVVEISVTDLDDSGAMRRYFLRLARYLEADEVRRRVGDDSAWFEVAADPTGVGCLDNYCP